MARREVNRPDNWSEITSEVGNRVRRRRMELGLTQERLAELAGISRNQVQNVERARGNSAAGSNPGLDLLWTLATAMDVEVGAFLPTRELQ